MSGRIKLRLVAFISAIALMVGLLAWTAYSSWQRTGELREKLTSVQLESFRIADHLQQTVLELNNLVLRFGIYRESSDWTRFRDVSTNLDHWIDAQRPILSTEKEKAILDQINASYDFYMAAARSLDARLATNVNSALNLVEFADFENQSQRLLNFGFQLAEAHRESMDSFLANSKRSLTYLSVLVLISLALLLVFGAGLAVVIYGGLIAPLRVKLVESQ